MAFGCMLKKHWLCTHKGTQTSSPRKLLMPITEMSHTVQRKIFGRWNNFQKQLVNNYDFERMFLKTQEYFQIYVWNIGITIPYAVAMAIAVFNMTPFSLNHFKKVSKCASIFSPNNNGFPHFLPRSFVTSEFHCMAVFSNWVSENLLVHPCKVLAEIVHCWSLLFAHSILVQDSDWLKWFHVQRLFLQFSLFFVTKYLACSTNCF